MLTAISASELHDDPSSRFWALVMYLAEHPEAEADQDLQAFNSAFRYDAEVLNGGHLQYFQNHGISAAPDAVLALEKIGATSHAMILQEALSKMLVSPIKAVRSLDEYSVLAMTEPFSEKDTRYYELQPSVIDLLESFIAPRLPTLIGIRHDA